MTRIIHFFTAREGPWRTDVFVIVLLAMALWVIPSGFREIVDHDETLYVHVARNIVRNDNWLVLYVHDRPYGEKPPLPFIAYAAMMKVAGGEIYSPLVRLPVHIATITVLLLVYTIGRHRFGRRAGLLSAFVLATIVQYGNESKNARLDMMFTMWITVALAIWLLRPDERKLHWGPAVGFWAAISAATLTKGPLCFFFVFSVVIFDAVRLRDWKVAVLGTKPILAIPMIGIPAYVWLSAVGQEAPDVMSEKIIGKNVIGRLTQRDTSHDEPIWYYFERGFTELAPVWGLVYVGFLVYWFRMGRREWDRLSPIVAWWLIPFIIMCIASGKRGTYLIPLFPAMALGVGWFLDRVVMDRQGNEKVGKVVGPIMGLAAVGLVVVGVLCIVAPGVAHAHENFVNAWHGLALLLLAAVCAAAAMMAFRTRGAWVAVFVAVIALIGSMQVVSFGVFANARNPVTSSRAFVTEVAGHIEGDVESAYVGVMGRVARPRYTFYAPFRTRRMDLDTDILKDPDTPSILVMETDEWKKRAVANPQVAEHWHVIFDGTVAFRDLVAIRKTP